MYLFLMTLIVLISRNFGCFPTPVTDGTPDIVITTAAPQACATCTLPKLDAPETDTSITTDGTVTITLDPNGCQVFTIRCVPTLPDGNNRPVCMGVNLQTIGLAFGNGPQEAVATCNDQGMVEATTTSGDTVIAESVYCCQNKMI
uniref:BIG2 domain-containing protein n=1 Tax=Panagrolaimus sp. PS1159 TaxID=55785 RepID=A0AC35GPY4_9BILA